MKIKNQVNAIILFVIVALCCVFFTSAVVLYKAYQNPHEIGEYFGLIIKGFKSVQ